MEKRLRDMKREREIQDREMRRSVDMYLIMYVLYLCLYRVQYYVQLCIELNKIEKERDINTRKKDLRRNLEIKRKRERGVEIVEKSTCREIALHSQRLATLTAGFCLFK